MKDRIYVTSPSLPPIEEYTKILCKAWDGKWLTNDGELLNEFEEKLCNYLRVKYVSLFNNATIALLIAQKAMDFKGEIITTPYSFIGSAHSIKWNGLDPVFVDTDSMAGNLLPETVESAINENTGGILAVHNYGVPGDVKGMQQVSKKYDLPLIYDAAPAMGVNYQGNTILKYGDLAVLSFHATKVFTTFEGGAIISRSAKMKEKIDQLKNFAILGPEKVGGLGINGKMNEAEAAMGLLQMRYIKRNIEKREKIYNLYVNAFKGIGSVRYLSIPSHVNYNYAYFPLFFEAGISKRDQAHKKLYDQNIICRKYWYPLISKHKIYNNEKRYVLPNALKLSESVLCIPIYPDLEEKDINRIIDIVISSL